MASRGLDIPDIDNIIHYHMPESEDGYIHRVGRTARWEAQGKAFFLLGPEEHIPEYVDAEIEDYEMPAADQLPAPAKPKMVTIYIGKGKKDKISKGDILGFLCKKGGLQLTEIGKIDVNDRYAYAAISRTKLRSLLNNVKGEKIKVSNDSGRGKVVDKLLLFFLCCLLMYNNCKIDINMQLLY